MSKNNNSESAPLLITIPQASKELALGRTTIYQLIRTAQIEAVKIGKSLRITRSSVEEFVRKLREESL